MSADTPTVEVHPFDVTALEKGDWITPGQCERVLGIDRHHPQFDLRLLALSQVLEKQWSEIRNEQVTICSEKNGLRICTDDKAVVVNQQRREQAKRAMGRALVRQGGVDRSKLTTPELRNLNEREMVVGAAFLAGGKREARAALQACKRSTPGLPKKH